MSYGKIVLIVIAFIVLRKILKGVIGVTVKVLLVAVLLYLTVPYIMSIL